MGNLNLFRDRLQLHFFSQWSKSLFSYSPCLEKCSDQLIAYRGIDLSPYFLSHIIQQKKTYKIYQCGKKIHLGVKKVVEKGFPPPQKKKRERFVNVVQKEKEKWHYTYQLTSPVAGIRGNSKHSATSNSASKPTNQECQKYKLLFDFKKKISKIQKMIILINTSCM